MANLQEQLSNQLILTEDVSLATSIYGRAVVSSLSFTIAGAIHGYEELSDSIVLTDQAGRVFAELLSDTATFSEILLRVFDESVSNDFRITQIVVQYNSGQKLLDAITLTDALTTISIYLRATIDSPNIADYSAGFIEYVNVGTFGPATTFTLNFIVPDEESKTEALGLSDSTVLGIIANRSHSNLVAVNHAMAHTTIYSRALTDTLVMSAPYDEVYFV